MSEQTKPEKRRGNRACLSSVEIQADSEMQKSVSVGRPQLGKISTGNGLSDIVRVKGCAWRLKINFSGLLRSRFSQTSGCQLHQLNRLVYCHGKRWPHSQGFGALAATGSDAIRFPCSHELLVRSGIVFTHK